MKKFSKIFLILIAFILVSCSNNKKEKQNDNSKTSNTEIVTAIKKQDYNFNPKLSNSLNNDSVVSQLFEGLTEYSSHGKVALNQAESIEKSQDFKKWTITLRENLKWSDGSNITAEDYVQSWISILNKENNNPNAFKLFFIKDAKKLYDGKIKSNEFKGITITDKNTIEVNMEYPVKNFDEILSNVFMFPTKKDSKIDKENLITNSAFKLKSYTDEEIILEQNENYWDNVNTKIKKVTLKLVENEILAYQLFDLKQIDFFGLPFYEIPYERRLDSSKKPELLNFKTNIFEFLKLDTENKMLQNNTLRKNLESLIDSKFLAEFILYNNSEPIFKKENLVSDQISKLKNEFDEILKSSNLQNEILTLKHNGTKLSERILASLSKEWIDKYRIKVSITGDSNASITHSTFNIGTTDEMDIKYYINHYLQNDDFSKMYTSIEDIKKDNLIFPLYKRSFSVLVHNNIQGLHVSPNGLLLIKNLLKQ
ncbi:ABC transporter substrate-binding protein [Parvimonas sp. D2]|uniref:ABC transporter substrate-binding protein n=1 Tax=unclassified Parvimonas TaxID=1151464 RepID=UPI002B49F8C2|nr:MULTISPECIES: ABC transporter substrate-binding protein [unclassified Parvimonas]MEB3011675.1 ABC transporter substrate-binding protein [Parvimonas sp. D2]MEB3087167.1 ABC transporter substrate-binding protein [Parvimonas sp. D4]